MAQGPEYTFTISNCTGFSANLYVKSPLLLHFYMKLLYNNVNYLIINMINFIYK